MEDFLCWQKHIVQVYLLYFSILFLTLLFVKNYFDWWFRCYRFSEFFRLTTKDYLIITLLKCMKAITEEHKIKSCYFSWEKVTRHLEWGSYHIFMEIYNYLNFLYFGSENIFQIINSNIKKPNILQSIAWYPWVNILIT